MLQAHHDTSVSAYNNNLIPNINCRSCNFCWSRLYLLWGRTLRPADYKVSFIYHNKVIATYKNGHTRIYGRGRAQERLFYFYSREGLHQKVKTVLPWVKGCDSSEGKRPTIWYVRILRGKLSYKFLI